MKHTLLIVCLVNLLSLFSLSAKEVNYIFRHYQVEHGLSDNMVTSCIQDKDGFIWIGTRDGLNRFDGYSFKVFRHDPEVSSTLGSNWITSLNCDQEGNLWVGTLAGLFRYDKEQESFHHLSLTANKRIPSFQFDRQNRLWMLMDGNLICYDQTDNPYRIFAHPNNLAYTSFCITSNQEIWVGDSNGSLSLVHEKEDRIETFPLFPNQPARKLQMLYPSSFAHRIYVAYEHDDIKIFDTDSHLFQDLHIQEANQLTFLINSLMEKEENELWIGTDSGLIIYQANTGECRRVQQDPRDPYALSSQYISAFCRDRENGIWICFHQNGINYYSPFQPFQIYYPGDGPNSMKGEVIRDICTDKFGNIWIGTEDAGINCLDKRTSLFTNYQPLPDNSGIAHTNIRSLAASDNFLWIGHVIHGIDKMDIQSRKVVKRYSLLKDSTSTKNSSVRCIKVLREGQIYVGTDDGVYKYDYLNDCFRYAPQFPAYSVRCIYEDRLGRIWTGMFNRSFYYNPISNTGMYLPYDKLNTQRHNFVNDICEDPEGNMWFATMEGVIKYDFQTGESVHYTVKNGMPSNVVFKILPDEEGCLWISSANGLVRLETKTGLITTYTENHGLISRQFNENSAFKDTEGNFYFGSIKGFIHFHPEEVWSDPLPAKVHLHTLELDNQEHVLNISPDSPLTRVTLKHNESTFNISFSTLSFMAPASVQYAYRMNGGEGRWTDIGERNTVYFTNLLPGHYLLEVRATNLSNRWSPTVTRLEIEVLPAWWASFPAKVVYGLVILALIGSVLYWWRNKTRQEMAYNMRLFEDQKEKELYQAKIEFFIHIAHEIRTPLTLIKNPLERVLQDKGLPGKVEESLRLMDKNVSRLLSLVNQLLDFRRTEIEGYRLNFVRTNLMELLKETMGRFQESAVSQGLVLNWTSSMTELYAYVDREAVTKIVSNLLANAIKYARKNIQIHFQLKDQDLIQIDFSNDGKTIPEELREKIFEPFYRVPDAAGKTGTGLGLPLARSLAEMHHGTLSLIQSTDLEMPTCFRLLLPLRQPESIQEPEEEHSIEPASDLQLTYQEGRATILVVEDNAEMRTFLAEELNSLYNVCVAVNGADAIEKMHHQSIQLVISDIMMPVMDGLELLKQIKTNVEFSHVPVILLTAKTTTQSKLEGLESGADAYIDKPFTMNLLLAQISNLLTNREHIRQFYFKSPMANMKSIAYSKTDEQFLEKLNGIILEHISDPELDVNQIAELMHISRPTLYRKIREISEMTPNDLIRITRLKRAAELLLQSDMKIYEIAEAVGFRSQSYFSTNFISQFGVSPSKYAQRNTEKTPKNAP